MTDRVRYLDIYRRAGETRDPEALAGRPAAATEIVNAGIRATIAVSAGATLVDIGCGDGDLLASFNYAGRRMGTTSTAPEAAALALRHEGSGVEFRAALADRLPIETGTADVVVCNGVLLMLPDEATVRRALCEMARIAKPGAQVYVGEIPQSERDWAGFLARPAQIIETHGPAELTRRLLARVARSTRSAAYPVDMARSRTSTSSPAYVTAGPEEFQGWCRAAGLEPVRIFRHEVKRDGRWLEYPRNRWNYLLRRAA